MLNISVLLGALILICLAAAPACGSFFHGPPAAVGVPVGVPFPVPVPVPSPVPVAVPAPVAVSDTVTIPAAYGYASVPSFHHSPPPAAHFKYAAAYAAPAPSIKYSLGAPVTTTTTTYSGFAAPHPPQFAAPPPQFAAPPPLQYAASHYAAPAPSQFYARFAPPPGYQLAAAPPAFHGRYKLRFGAPPAAPAAVYGAPPPPPSLSYAANQGW